MCLLLYDRVYESTALVFLTVTVRVMLMLMLKLLSCQVHVCEVSVHWRKSGLSPAVAGCLETLSLSVFCRSELKLTQPHRSPPWHRDVTDVCLTKLYAFSPRRHDVIRRISFLFFLFSIYLFFKLWWVILCLNDLLSLTNRFQILNCFHTCFTLLRVLCRDATEEHFMFQRIFDSKVLLSSFLRSHKVRRAFPLQRTLVQQKASVD